MLVGWLDARRMESSLVVINYEEKNKFDDYVLVYKDRELRKKE